MGGAASTISPSPPNVYQISSAQLQSSEKQPVIRLRNSIHGAHGVASSRMEAISDYVVEDMPSVRMPNGFGSPERPSAAPQGLQTPYLIE